MKKIDFALIISFLALTLVSLLIFLPNEKPVTGNVVSTIITEPVVKDECSNVILSGNKSEVIKTTQVIKSPVIKTANKTAAINKSRSTVSQSGSGNSASETEVIVTKDPLPTDNKFNDTINIVVNYTHYDISQFEPRFRLDAVPGESWCDAYGTIQADVGDELAFMNSSGHVVGTFMVHHPGYFGFSHVYAIDKQISINFYDRSLDEVSSDIASFTCPDKQQVKVNVQRYL